MRERPTKFPKLKPYALLQKLDDESGSPKYMVYCSLKKAAIRIIIIIIIIKTVIHEHCTHILLYKALSESKP